MKNIVDPTYCRRKVMDVHGEHGAQWLAQLPEFVEECAARWSLEVLPPFPIESYCYVAPAVRVGEGPVVLKIGYPSYELSCQIEALRYWNGSGICRLFEAEAERGFLLMERVLPGDSLKSIPDDEVVTEVALGVMQRLWKPVPEKHAFPSISDWAGDFQKLHARFDGGFGPFPVPLVERAERLFAELIGENSPCMLIHGDMNWGNILRGAREPWLAIDPKGVVGNPLFDVATFLNDPPVGLSRPELIRLKTRRIEQIAERLEVDRQLVKDWAQAHCVLAGYWTYEDHNGVGWEKVFEMAAMYDEIM